MAKFNYPGYPQNVLEPSTPYIYFNSLLYSKDGGEIIYKTVKPFFEAHINEITYNTEEITLALQYLKKIIDNEASKEIAFINHFSSQFSDLDELTIPTLQSDWTNFVQTIQKKLTVGDNELNSLRVEKQRLQHNYKIAQSEDKKAYDFIDTTADYNSTEITKLYNFLRGSSTKESVQQQILDLILDKFGNKLLQFDKNTGELIFSPSTLTSLLVMIQSLVMKQYANLNIENLSKVPDLSKIENILKNDKFNKEIEAYIEKIQLLPFLGDDIIRSLDFQKPEVLFSKEESEQLRQVMTQQKKSEKKEKSAISVLQKILKKKQIISSDNIKIISNGNAYAEIESMFTAALSKSSIYSSNTGSAGAKPDNLFAYLSIDLTQLDLHDEQVRSSLQTIHEAMQELDYTLEKTNDLDYYERREAAWNKAESIINEQLNLLQKKYKDLDCFIIEDSTKNYTTLYRNEHYGRVNSEFHGGSLGPNITDQLQKLNALQIAGGLTPMDVDWLLAAAINAGPGMIVSRNQRHLLEQYLSTFACILLFDDQLNIAKEAIDKIDSETNKVTTHVKKIHLFSLNGGYYPLSYVLSLTYDNLQKAYFDAEALVLHGSGAKTHITGFVEEPKKPYKDTAAVKLWATTADKAKATTKIKISFLTNFMNILNSLYPT